MAAPTLSPRVIIDPSVLLAEEALTWLPDPELQSSIVISRGFWNSLADSQGATLPSAFGADPSPDHLRRLSETLAPIQRFSHRRAILPELARPISDRLLSGANEKLGEVFADEWSFLMTQSVLFLQEPRITLEAFAAAGALVYFVSRDQMQLALRMPKGKLPPRLRKVMKPIAQQPMSRAGKWLLWGGGLAAEIFHTHLGTPGTAFGIATNIHQGIAIVAGDP
jgi:hypothetical protein